MDHVIWSKKSRQEKQKKKQSLPIRRDRGSNGDTIRMWWKKVTTINDGWIMTVTTVVGENGRDNGTSGEKNDEGGDASVVAVVSDDYDEDVDEDSDDKECD